MSESTKKVNTCFYCNTTMNIELDAFMVMSIGGRSGF